MEADGDDVLADPSFESELVSEEGHEFTYTFEEAGTYDYVCEVHINQAMLGSVRVLGENMSVEDVDNVEETTDDEDSDDRENMSVDDDGDGDEMSDSGDSDDDSNDGESESPSGNAAESEGLPGFTVATAMLALFRSSGGG